MILRVFISYFDLDITLITPGGVPGVFYEPVVQAGGLISAVTDNENCVVDWVKVQVFCEAIDCIDDAACILMDVLAVGGNSNRDGLLRNGFLNQFYCEIVGIHTS